MIWEVRQLIVTQEGTHVVLENRFGTIIRHVIPKDQNDPSASVICSQKLKVGDKVSTDSKIHITVI